MLLNLDAFRLSSIYQYISYPHHSSLQVHTAYWSWGMERANSCQESYMKDLHTATHAWLGIMGWLSCKKTHCDVVVKMQEAHVQIPLQPWKVMGLSWASYFSAKLISQGVYKNKMGKEEPCTTIWPPWWKWTKIGVVGGSGLHGKEYKIKVISWPWCDRAYKGAERPLPHPTQNVPEPSGVQLESLQKATEVQITKDWFASRL